MKAKRRTAEEEREKFAREYHSAERVKWVASLGCVACGSKRKVENHHTRNEGMGRKGSYRVIVPLCGTVSFEGYGGCHQRCERIGKLSFLQRLHSEGGELKVAGTLCDSWEAAAERVEELGRARGYNEGLARGAEGI